MTLSLLLLRTVIMMKLLMEKRTFGDKVIEMMYDYYEDICSSKCRDKK